MIRGRCRPTEGGLPDMRGRGGSVAENTAQRADAGYFGDP